MDEKDEYTQKLEELLGEMWLYIPWREVTRNFTTEQKELFADVVDAQYIKDVDPEAGPVADRWWQ